MAEDKKNKKNVQKYKLEDVDDIWNSLLADESSDLDDEQFEGENLLYADSYSDPSSENEQALGSEEQFESENLLYDSSHLDDFIEDEPAIDIGEQSDNDNLLEEHYADSVIEDEQTPEEPEKPEKPEEPEEPAQLTPGADECSAVLTFVGGTRQEVARARLFQPQNNTILLIDEETNDELVIFFEQLACLQIADLPAGISARQKESGTKEIIETADKNTYHVLVSSSQDLTGLLCCFSTEDQSPFPVILFPRSNIRKRWQDKLLSDILLEKRFISRSILRKALQEFEQIKSMSIEKTIAQKSRVPLTEIEEALDSARQNGMLGMQPGEILLMSGLINEVQILEAIEYHEHITTLEIGQFLMDKGLVKEMEVYISLAEQHRIPFIDLRQRKIPNEFLALLPANMMITHEILPLLKKDDILLVATHSIDMTHLSESIAAAAGCKQVKYVLSPPAQIRKIIQLLHAQ